MSANNEKEGDFIGAFHSVNESVWSSLAAAILKWMDVLQGFIARGNLQKRDH